MSAWTPPCTGDLRADIEAIRAHYYGARVRFATRWGLLCGSAVGLLGWAVIGPWWVLPLAVAGMLALTHCIRLALETPDPPTCDLHGF